MTPSFFFDKQANFLKYRATEERIASLEAEIVRLNAIITQGNTAVKDITDNRDKWFGAYDRLRAEFCQLQEKHNM